MSGYNPTRRGPNVSQYLQNLNAISTENEASQHEEFGLGDDLDKWASSEFLNFDVVDGLDFAPNGSSGGKQNDQGVDIAHKAREYGYSGDFALHDANFISNDSPLERAPVQPSFGQVSHYDMDFSTHQPSMDAFNYPQSAINNTIGAIDKGPNGAMDQPTNNNGGSPPPSNSPTDTAARAAAEEDKRRRNTAASARFRVKKKQREQALEKQAKEMSDRVEQLGHKIQALERENKWLRGLVTEKTGKDDHAVDGMWSKFESEQGKAERKPDTWKKGVGTEAMA